MGKRCVGSVVARELIGSGRRWACGEESRRLRTSVGRQRGVSIFPQKFSVFLLLSQIYNFITFGRKPWWQAKGVDNKFSDPGVGQHSPSVDGGWMGPCGFWDKPVRPSLVRQVFFLLVFFWNSFFLEGPLGRTGEAGERHKVLHSMRQPAGPPNLLVGPLHSETGQRHAIANVPLKIIIPLWVEILFF